MGVWKRLPPMPEIPGEAFERGSVLAIRSIDDGLWHLSVSCRNRNPTWKELHDARYDLIPDEAVMAQILPSKREYVNLHSHCFHLWQIGGPKPQILE